MGRAGQGSGHGRDATVGATLRRWREQVAGCSQRSAASQIGVRPSLWSGWESGREAIGHRRMNDLDDLFGAGGTLAALLEAAGTSQAFAARTAWWFNVQGPSRPWWIWIRPADVAGGANEAVVTLRWGPSFIPPLNVGPGGVVITTPVSVPNPPLSVCFVEGEGWVDIGPGRLPREFAMSTLNGVRLMRSPTPDFGTFVAVDGIRRLMGRSVSWPQAVRTFFGDSDFISDVLAVREAPNTSEDVSEHDGEVVRAVAGGDFSRARIGRGYSRAEAARAITAFEPTHPVSEHQVQRLEAGRDPRPCLLRARLDALYRADGHLGCEPVPVRALDDDVDGVRVGVALPSWWIGPIWFRVADPAGGLVPLRVEWGRWAKNVLLRPDQTVTARRPTYDYAHPQLVVPHGVGVTAGIGRAAGAADINKNWMTIDSRATAWLLGFTGRNYLEAFGKTASQAVRMILGHRLGPTGESGDEAGEDAA